MSGKQKQRLERTKNRRTEGAFVPLPVKVSQHPNYHNLSGNGLKLLVDMCFQLRFRTGGPVNNGDISIPWSIMSQRGWSGKGTIRRAELELLHYGFIELTRQGGRNRCNLYAVTWWAVDECDGKLEVNATHRPKDTWKEVRSKFRTPRKKLETVPRSSYHAATKVVPMNR